MMLSVDEVQKMKVVELRAELTARNLDVRGVKAVLVERLLDALMTETGENSTPATAPKDLVVPVNQFQEVKQDSGVAVPTASLSALLSPTRVSRNNDSPTKTTVVTPAQSPVKTPQKVTPTIADVSNVLPVSPLKVSAPPAPTTPVKAATPTPLQVSPAAAKVLTPPAAVVPIRATVSPVKPVVVPALVVPTRAVSPVKQAVVPAPVVPTRAVSPVKQVVVPATLSSPVAGQALPKSGTADAGTTQQATLPQTAIPAPGTPSNADVKESAVPATGETSVQSEPSQAGVTPNAEEPMEVEEAKDDKKRKLDILNNGNQTEEVQKSKKFKQEERKKVVENEPDFEGKGVVLDWYKSDLNVRISETDFLKAEQIVFEEFPWAFAGVKATHGFNGGKVCFEAKWVGSKDIKADLGGNVSKHVLRIGWSDLLADLQLGEEKFSYGYDSNGKFYVDNEEAKEGGEPFAKDDVVATYLNFESDPVEIQFSKNGTIVGTPIQIPKSDLEGKILFPHILVRNASFEANFGSAEPAHALLENYQMVGKVGDEVEHKIRGPQRAATKGECEFVMLCGMACSGKTRWAKEKKAAHPEQHFNILGTSTVVERVAKDIAVSGLLMTRTWLPMAGKFVEKLVDIAPSRRRNYILDQSNVLPNVQKRKAGGFDGFKRRAVVILPSDEEYQNRIKSREQEQGKSVPKSTVLDMKAGFRLPEAGDLFDEVEYSELVKEAAVELVGKYNKEGVAAGYGQRPLTVRGGGMRNSRGMRGGPRGSGRGFFRGDPRGGRGVWRGPPGRGGPPPFRGGPPPRGFRGGRFPGGMAIPSIERVSRDPSRGFGRGGGGGAPRGIPALAIRRGSGGGGGPPRGGPPRGGARGGGGGSWERGSPLNGGGNTRFPRGRGGPMNRNVGGRGGSSAAPMYNNNGSNWGGSPPATGFGQGRFNGPPSGGFGQQARFGGNQGNQNNRASQGGGFPNQSWGGGQSASQIWDRPNSGNSGFQSFGGSSGSVGNQFADPWTQQVPDQGYGQSWDNSGSSLNMSGNGGRGGGGGGGGTWQGYGGQTYGNYNPGGGYGRK